MRKMTEESLSTAFAGESQAHMRYLIFAQKAEEEGYPNIARLFRAIAFAEQVHATNHFKALGNLGASGENLNAAIEGETFEVEEMYPAYDAIAKLQQEKGARTSIHYALEAEKIHAAMYSQARQAVESGNDIEIKQIHICSVCGYTGEGEPPARCPVCGAPMEKFQTF
ncbi:MAG TPA: rubrerythrin family protein [Deltaproteobacteria bacterium]|nr:rubrerythrin family protein [bacterium]RKY74768.1 MAG: rubrerythrin family protein [candidate division KSB1 bacterium]RKY77015.1 MAG: rubrerythrin family protein [candidate division KSB1 bacterium]RKY84456.1 MAG: rubrerythrin family protein [candidate division KSB1 bacterium]HDM75287.1 rubrerythrin family protein [Deltaproteobacteria bacterium]